MGKILIWRQIVPGSDIDIWEKTDYAKLDTRIKNIYKGICPNWGNKLWFQGLYSEIDTPENEITFRTNESIEEINEKYDLVIWPMANFFGEKYASDTSEHVKVISQLKIPMYIVACGAQAAKYDDLQDLVNKIGEPSRRFIDAVYHTGGEFALRGYFTKEFFSKLGFESAVVTGCPSMYQMGRNFRVSVDKVSHGELKTIITGKIAYFENLMNKVAESVYLSQELYEDCLYRSGYFSHTSLKRDIQFVTKYSIQQAHLLGEGRIKMICDTNDWFHYIKDNGFNFAFGTKIHGSIMPILAGTPAMLVATDSRTAEMADFYDIPYIQLETGKQFSLQEFHEAYDKMDYTKFNASYQRRFEQFEHFLVEHGIVKRINDDNRFFLESGNTGFDEYLPNQDGFKEYAKRLERERLILKAGQNLNAIRKRIM